MAAVYCEDILFLLFMRMWLWAFCNHQASLLNEVIPKQTALGASLDMDYRAACPARLLACPHGSYPTPRGLKEHLEPVDYSFSDAVVTAQCCDLG